MRGDGVVWARSPLVASVETAARAVVLDLSAPETAQPRALMGTAALIWRAVAEPASLDEVCCSVERQLSEPHGDLRNETAQFLRLLASEGLVICTSQATAAQVP